nr:PH domain-containing protein [Sphingomonas kaistensis]
MHWRRFSFRVGSDAIRIDSGILSRNQRTIPFDRVADVSIAQGPLQRLFGIARVTLETGGSGAGKEEGVLDGIALHRAEALREHVRTMRLGASGAAVGEPAAVVIERDEDPPLFAMDLRRLLTLGMFNFSLAIFAGLFGASQTVGDALNIDPFERTFWTPILSQYGLGDWLLAHRIGLAVAGVAVLVLAGLATGIVRTVLRDYGFRLDRTGNGFRRRRGLLTRTDVSLPARRIQAGLIATGPLRNRFGWRAFKVLSLAGEGGQPGKEGRDDHVLAPLATEDEVAGIAAAIGLAIPDEATPWRPVSRGHLTSFVAVVGALMLLGAVAGLLFLAALNAPAEAYVAPPLLALAGVAGLGLLRWFEWRHTAYALEAGRLLIRTGWWSRRTLLVPLRNVQSVTLRESSLSRRFGIASLAVDVAGGRSGGQIVPSLPRDQASLLHRELLSAQP